MRRRNALQGLAGLLLAGCGSPAAVPDRATPQIGRTLDRRAAALLRRDESGYLAAVDPTAHALRAAQRAEFRNLADLPLSSWAYHLGPVRRTGDRATVQADLRYRIAGYDSAPVSTPRTLELRERHGRWYVTADRPGEDGAQALWQQGPVTAVRGSHSLVLGAEQGDTVLRSVSAVADAAVPAVNAAWPGPWAHRVVVLVPGSLAAMAALLGAPAAGYTGIAAVTTGETGGSGATPADRIIVNPEAYAELGDFGQHIVLTHETTHVATRTVTSAATPTWLSEGFADWAAYRTSDRTAAQIAPELRTAVQLGHVPATLPDDEDFAFGGDADRLAQAYEGGWLACELIATRWGDRHLTDFYRAVGEHGGRDGAVENALNDVLKTTPDDFTALWRGYLRKRLG
ncbi:lipoprotein [Streptomyces sp. AcH 505]|uniref:lipoprotein n=1 Tax=Streptomyces sp. AcH 505 TaxID=352211 RepID=UPI000591C513|nr:lipoprotein [Streptomyces sp. AcH 505]